MKFIDKYDPLDARERCNFKSNELANAAGFGFANVTALSPYPVPKLIASSARRGVSWSARAIMSPCGRTFFSTSLYGV
jgi:hypothetical protein